VNQADLEDLERLITEAEVWDVVKELPSDRALGPDGFIGIFYQKAWSIIKGDVMRALTKLSVGDGRGFQKLNRALITLIPKKADAIQVGDFRPISLVHSFPKLFSKILANRLRPKMGELISMNQSAFILGRSLHDNFFLVKQVARQIHSRRGKGVFLKLDILRAFDSLSWPFLIEVLRHMGFVNIFPTWVSLLLRTASTRVVVNGVLGERIHYVRGLRQGDPTSPQFFVMAMKVLTMLVVRAVEVALINGIPGCALKQRVSVYADDVAMFVKPGV
jgi:hypothetical protein